MLLYLHLFAVAALAPVLINYSIAQTWFPPSSMIVPTLALFVFAVALYAMFRAVFRMDGARACNSALLSLLFLSLYKYLYLLLSFFADGRVGSPLVHAVLVGAFCVLLVALVARGKGSVYLMGSTVYSITLAYGIVLLFSSHAPAGADAGDSSRGLIRLAPVTAEPPDIFLTIADCYASEQVIRKAYGYDNSPFTQELKKHGFFIADRSRANYLQTRLSLASSLNVEYLDRLVDLKEHGDADAAVTLPVYEDNSVMKSLSRAGYQILIMPSTFPPMAQLSGRYSSTDERAQITLTHVVIDFSVLGVRPSRSRALSHYELVDDAFERILQETKARAGTRKPLFVYTHLIAPHAPYVADEEGKPREFLSSGDFMADAGTLMLERWRAEHPEKSLEYFYDYDRLGYVNNVRFFNQRFLAFVAHMKAHYPRPYVLVLQGDHGCSPLQDGDETPAHKYNRSHILNAFYFPDGSYAALYPEISPVNSFRVVFNQYLSAGLPLLEDKTYYSDYSNPLRFEELVGE